MRKLNLGAGDFPLDGYENRDIKKNQPLFPLDVPNGSIDEIRASHVLEHLSFAEIPLALLEWRRALKRGGRVRISVPDAARIEWARNAGNPLWPFLAMGGQTDEYDFHRSIFDEALLTEYLTACGFDNVRRWQSEGNDTSNLPVSLNLEADK